MNLLKEFLDGSPLPFGSPTAPVCGLLTPDCYVSSGIAAVLGLPATPIGAVPILFAFERPDVVPCVNYLNTFWLGFIPRELPF